MVGAIQIDYGGAFWRCIEIDLCVRQKPTLKRGTHVKIGEYPAFAGVEGEASL